MLKRMRSFLVVVMLLITATMSAQVTTASMSGKVTAQDEPIIGATIVAIHEPSGTRYGTVTNVSGHKPCIRRKLCVKCFFEGKFRVIG